MFRKLGNLVARRWPFLLVGWICLLLGINFTAPEFDSVVRDGQFSYLPEDVPSRVGESLFRDAFSRDLLRSSVVLVARRESGDEGLTEDDRIFIEEVLAPRLRQIAREEGGMAVDASSNEDADSEEDIPDQTADSESETQHASIISRIRTFNDRKIGDLLQSKDNRASLVIVELTTEFMQLRNHPTISKIEQLIEELQQQPREEMRTPPGLDLSISGSAAVGRDMRTAARQSASATELWTILLVVALLIVIYRAPILALIPLLTVFVSVEIALKALSLAAQAGMISLFSGIEIYVTVVMYGAGVDYCMFLMARYKEELDDGATLEEAISNAVGKVGAALAASAGTTMCGIGMMVFAQFGKFQQAGVAMSLSLFFVLCASLTFTPSLLRLTGRWAFWPKVRSERVSTSAGWISPTNMIAWLMQVGWFRGIWQRIGDALLKNPGTIWIVSVAAMAPFAVCAVMNFNFLSYGLLSELPSSAPSVVGTKAVQAHFPAGVTGPVTILLKNPSVDFRSTEGIEAIEELTERLKTVNDRQQLGIADFRSVANPLGVNRADDDADSGGSFLARLTQRKVKRKRAIDFYVSDKGDLSGQVARIDVIFQDDPFSRNSIQQFDVFRDEVAAALPDRLAGETELFFIGATPSISDLKSITGQDQIRIDILVIVGVFLILLILLRRPAISAYLILSVFFSYLVTLGVTFAVFWSLDPTGFAGLDWKVPMFLFTILIAVGEDYNIYLITRIDEEQKLHGPVRGIAVALSKTGSIISSCGLIMAGTFSSLMAGSLVGMNQLGFALAFGVLLDTFVVRPILVPAYLILLHQGRFGSFGKLLGANSSVSPGISTPVNVGGDSRNRQRSASPDFE